ncbi:hypothetical protein BU24DRAFT_61609 [Aaosphaeria arxii CBS 175.79]|uniref:Uncharacterized protein n=1 Tax=Aaosphaeria arxii CBS 175.79 TaxID=1450172 RepID=A0A6A5XBY8_9PLEO|nr:uncharacterized protein BU24DRAFT_61609 [Aaosphaeria arxii CBS 175.79]KAF2010605.1 hypothetical protein BU24DRAFT_61609 [Aaosphaeria arxii CBS 175.79]
MALISLTYPPLQREKRKEETHRYATIQKQRKEGVNPRRTYIVVLFLYPYRLYLSIHLQAYQTNLYVKRNTSKLHTFSLSLPLPSIQSIHFYNPDTPNQFFLSKLSLKRTSSPTSLPRFLLLFSLLSNYLNLALPVPRARSSGEVRVRAPMARHWSGCRVRFIRISCTRYMIGWWEGEVAADKLEGVSLCHASGSILLTREKERRREERA